MESSSRLLKLLRWVSAFALIGVASSAFAFGTTARFVILTNEDTQFSTGGTWSFVTSGYTTGNPTYYGENYRRIAGSGGAATGTAAWEFGNIAPSPGNYSFEAFIPDNADNSGSDVQYFLQSASYSLISGCGSYSNAVTFTPANADGSEGRWLSIGVATLQPGICYRLVLTNANNLNDFILANAVRAERLFESSLTISDMPRVATVFAPATTLITSSSNPAPTIVTTLTVTCPQIGNVMVTATGESAAQTNVAGTNFNGLAYSISRNSTATDNANVVQSSSLATFSGDANRDFLNASRVDSCTAGESVTYRLTAYRAQPATGPASFIYNARLIGQYFATGF